MIGWASLRRCGPAALAAVCLVYAGIARAAQDDEDPVDVVNSPPQSFMTMDRMDSATRLGAQLGLTRIEGPVVSPGSFAVRLEIHGQLVLASKRAGFYGGLPFSQLVLDESSSSGFVGKYPRGVSNLQAGGYLLVGGGNGLIVRGGFSLPFASSTIGSNWANGSTTWERLTDTPTTRLGFLILRLSASTVRDRGPFFLRADLGGDLVLQKPEGFDEDYYLRANLAGGVHTSTIDLALELANFCLGDDFQDEGGFSISRACYHTAAFGLRTRGRIQIHSGIVLPLDVIVRGDIWIMSFGVQTAH
jgi:hypothetical protein